MSQLYMNVDNPRGKVCKPILTVSLTDFPWLHGPIGRAEVQQLIDDNGNREGLFLVRESTRVPGSYVLSCVALGTVQHYIIQDEGGVYRIDDGPPFSCLEDLIDHYHKPDDRLPTVLTTYCPRPGALPAINQQESYENMWNAQHTAQAQVASSKPIATQQPAVFSATQQMKSMTLQPQVSNEGGVAYASSLDASETLARTSGTPTSTEKAATMVALNSTRDFRKAKSVQSWIQKSEEVMKQEIHVTDTLKRKSLDGLQQSGTTGADAHFDKFDRAARAEEKMYVLWMNNHLKESGKSISDLGPSLRNGVLVMQVLSKIALLPPLKYAKRTLVVQQELDNWHVIVRFMRKLGIQVDPLPQPGGEAAAINPIALHEGDRREMLKLFSKAPFPNSIAHALRSVQSEVISFFLQECQLLFTSRSMDVHQGPILYSS